MSKHASIYASPKTEGENVSNVTVKASNVIKLLKNMGKVEKELKQYAANKIIKGKCNIR